MTLHHIGYLVKNMDKARRDCSLLGFEQSSEITYDEYRDVNICFFTNDGFCVELVSPVSDRSVVAGLMKRYKNSPYHICYISDDLEKDIKRLSEAGCTQIDMPTPAPALEDRRACFLMSAHIGMIELVESCAVGGPGISQVTDGMEYHQYVLLHPCLLGGTMRRMEGVR